MRIIKKPNLHNFFVGFAFTLFLCLNKDICGKPICFVDFLNYRTVVR